MSRGGGGEEGEERGEEAGGPAGAPGGPPDPAPLPAGGAEGARRPTSTGILLAVVAAAYLALALPLVIPAPHTGGDNAGYLALANSLLEGRYVESWDPAEPPHTKYPPGYPLLLAAAILLGAGSWTAFKALSVAAVGGAVLLSFLLARRRLGTAGALAVALLLALSDAFLWASTWILSEPLFLLLSLGGLALLDRRDSRETGPPGAPARALLPVRPLPPPLLLAAGAALALLACFTRTAGVALVGAVGGWLLLRRAWRPLVAYGAAFGVPALLWILRGRASRAEGYLSEFWMADPYRPELGRVGIPELGGRAVDNLVLYATEYIPRGLVAVGGGWVPALGILLLGLAAVGWFRSVRRGVGPVELFVPLYGALILLWPQVWSGDRFALPLYPLLLVHAGEALGWLGARAGARGRVALAGAAVLSVAVPAAAGWWQGVPGAAGCRAVVGQEGPWACYDLPVREFAESARWSASALPPDAVVFSRKPRIFHVSSGGLRSLTFPFSDDPEGFFREAEGAGIRYVLVDRLDDLSAIYLVPVIGSRPERFCALAGWGDPEGIRTELLGILPEARAEAVPGEGSEGTVLIRRCPPDYVAEELRPEFPHASMQVPLLAARGSDD